MDETLPQNEFRGRILYKSCGQKEDSNLSVNDLISVNVNSERESS